MHDTTTHTPGQRLIVKVDGQEHAGIVLGVRSELVDGAVTDVLDVEVTDGAASDDYRHAPAVTVPAADVLDDDRAPAVKVYLAGKAAGRREALAELVSAADDGPVWTPERIGAEVAALMHEAVQVARLPLDDPRRRAFLERKAALLARIEQRGAL